jgi:hypothetical protein
MVDPLKVYAIVNLPPPRTISQLQSLQGKENFLRIFIVNYVEIMKCFICLLKNGVPFVWDNQAQQSLYSLKNPSMSTTLLTLPNYGRDILLYLVAYESTIGMVLIQEYGSLKEHIIYYFSKGFTGPKL